MIFCVFNKRYTKVTGQSRDTYLKENDPQLFTKIATNPHDARKPEKDDIDNASG